MSWIQKLYETYDLCSGNPSIPDSDDLCPVGYSIQNAHIEVVIDEKGEFRRASLIDKNDAKTLIPVTEKSLTGRTSGIAPHPLCDTLQYCAGDYSEYGSLESYFDYYLPQIEKWAKSQYSHQKVMAVYAYVCKKSLIKDLKEILCFEDSKLFVSIKDNKDIESKNYQDHNAMKLLSYDSRNVKEQGKLFVRWAVESEDNLCPQTWKDKSLQNKWIEYSNVIASKKGYCYVTGMETFIAEKHPGKIRHGGDKAKLISSNDTNGFTFLGRFKSAEEAASISSEVTEKAHSALRWLIGRKQSFRSGDQVFISWSIAGKTIPDPWANTFDIFAEETGEKEYYEGDVGQAFAHRLNKKIAGYKASVNDTENIVVMGLDSATPGRMAITFYRELTGSEFLERIEKWHFDYAWFQNFGKETKFIGAPSPRDIAWCAYGKKIEGKNGIKLLNATVERILPSIVDGRSIAKDLVEQSVRRTSNRAGLESWEFEKCLGITCSLYRGFCKTTKEEFSMSLDENRETRDYLYGRLLAVADCLEGFALSQAEKGRPTNAERLMQRFANHPFSTWRNIELALSPYKARLGAKGIKYDKTTESIMNLFVPDDFANDSPLSGEFLLGFYAQRSVLKESNSLKNKKDDVENNNDNTTEGA